MSGFSKIRIFLKKSAAKFAGKQKKAYLCTRNQENNLLQEEKRSLKKAYLCTRNQENNLLQEEKRSLKGLHKTRQHKEA